jgi:two-component system sensor histidine kinase MtrB
VGLKPGEAALVFTRFWRADPARARTTGGTGLGLAIALEDARLHAGRLEAWGALGEGSCFRLTLPRKADATITSSPLPLSPLAAEAAEAAEAQAAEAAAAAHPAGSAPAAHGPHSAHPAADAAATAADAEAEAAEIARASGFADDDTLRLRRIVPERTP